MPRTLEELDGSEAKLMLLDLPPFDIDRVSCILPTPHTTYTLVCLMQQLLQDAANLRVTYSLPRPVAD
jgi:hypothetical protein